MKNWIIVLGTIFALAIIGGITYKSFFASTIKTVIGKGGKQVIINTDSHQKSDMYRMEYGVAQARRGWAEKKDIINTNSVDKLLEYFKK